MKIVLNLIFAVAKMLTDPSILFGVLVIIVIILKRKNKYKRAWIGIIISASVMLIIMTGIAGKFTANYLQKEYSTQTPTVSSPYVIVMLGGETVSLNKTQQSHIISYSRIITALKLYQSSKNNKQPCKILVSRNGNRNRKSEAALYASSFIEMGISEADILKEDKSMSTYENVKYSSTILRKLSASKVYLVTSGFHMKRSVLLFKTFGVNVLPCPSDIINTVPNSYNATMTSLMMGELVGIWQVQLYNKLRLN